MLMGDGELDEGSNWEAAATSSPFGPDNLLVFVDHNGLQIGGVTTAVINYKPPPRGGRPSGGAFAWWTDTAWERLSLRLPPCSSGRTIPP